MPVVSVHTPSPGARTFGQLKNELARYVKMPTDSEALSVCGDAIVDAIRYYNAKTWKWNITYQDITLVVNTADYDLSSQVKEPRYAELLDASGNSVSRLKYQDPRSFLEWNFPITASGSPDCYTLMNNHATGTLTVNYAPTTDFITSYPTLRLWYYRRIQHPTADSDEIDVPSEAEGGIIWKAKALVTQVYDPKKVQLAEQEHAERWRLLRADNSDEQHDWE